MGLGHFVCRADRFRRHPAVGVNYLQAKERVMGEKLDEGLLFDLLEKRRAGKFTADELLWAADHPEVIRWAMARPKVVAGIRRILAVLPAEMTIGGVTYEILSFLKGDEKFAVGHTMVSRAKEIGANLGKEDCEHILAHQGEIPAALRGKIVFVFPDMRHPDGRGSVACLRWGDGGWYRGFSGVARVWYGYDRLLRRK
jgi:hypothetical protein